MAFLGDSLAEQVSKALLGMLGHAGHAATKTEHGDVFSMDKAPSKEEFIARPKKRHPRYWKQRDFRRRLTESGMEVLERFKLRKGGPRPIGGHRRQGKVRAARCYLRELRAALQERQSLRERSAVLLRLDETRQKIGERATLIWRETRRRTFPVASGTHEEMMQLNYDGGLPALRLELFDVAAQVFFARLDARRRVT